MSAQYSISSVTDGEAASARALAAPATQSVRSPRLNGWMRSRQADRAGLLRSRRAVGRRAVRPQHRPPLKRADHRCARRYQESAAEKHEQDHWDFAEAAKDVVHGCTPSAAAPRIHGMQGFNVLMAVSASARVP